ncbi:hypothetical protein GCM10027446_13770 [Angustibacter peucedani]
MSDTTRTRTTRRTAGVAGVAAAAVLALALSACTPAQAGAAAVVDGRRITVDQVSAATTGIKTGNPDLAEGEGLDRTVLFFLVISPWVLRAAEENGVGVSTGEAEKLLTKTDDPDPGSVLVLRTYLALQKLQQGEKTEALTQVQKDVTAAKPELNPRYGTFDLKQMAVVDAPPNWLVPGSEPTATATDAP